MKKMKYKKMTKKDKLFLVIGIFFLVLFSTIFIVLNRSVNNLLTKDDAVNALKRAYPEFKDYPSDRLPPRSIEIKQASRGWYVKFTQEGSGIPILQAQCFLVKYSYNIIQITKTGEYKGGDITKTTVSTSTCK